MLTLHEHSLDSFWDVQEDFVVQGVVQSDASLHTNESCGCGGDVVEQIHEAGGDVTPDALPVVLCAMRYEVMTRAVTS